MAVTLKALGVGFYMSGCHCRCHCLVQCLGAMFGWRDGKSHDIFDRVQSLQVPSAVLFVESS